MYLILPIFSIFEILWSEFSRNTDKSVYLEALQVGNHTVLLHGLGQLLAPCMDIIVDTPVNSYTLLSVGSSAYYHNVITKYGLVRQLYYSAAGVMNVLGCSAIDLSCLYPLSLTLLLELEQHDLSCGQWTNASKNI